jgi:hypothetical protein
MVHEARGETKQAANCYRKVIEIIRGQPDNYDPEFADVFVKLVDKLDPPAVAYSTRSLRSHSSRAPPPRPSQFRDQPVALYTQTT